MPRGNGRSQVKVVGEQRARPDSVGPDAGHARTDWQEVGLKWELHSVRVRSATHRARGRLNIWCEYVIVV